MSGRRFFLDSTPGERRAVVTLDDRPERLMIERTGHADGPRLGARYCGRVRKIDRALGMAFLDLGGDEEAVMSAGRLAIQVGSAVEVEIAAEPRRGKSALATFDGPSARPPGVIRAAPDAAARLAQLAAGEPIVDGDEAREVADEAQDLVLAIEHPVPGGGTVAIEPTRALVAVDVDQGGRGGSDQNHAARQANVAALAEIARLLRLKALGGLVVIDLIGKGQGGEALMSAARKAFEADQPGVVLGPLNKFGVLTLALPHRLTPVAEMLLDVAGRPTPRTVAQALLREMQREARSDPGALLRALCAPDVAAELEPLAQQLGPRFRVVAELGRSRLSYEIRAQ